MASLGDGSLASDGDSGASDETLCASETESTETPTGLEDRETFVTDYQRAGPLLLNFQEREWVASNADLGSGSWNIAWHARPNSWLGKKAITGRQLVNHFPGEELTQKRRLLDSFVLYIQSLRAVGNPLAEKDMASRPIYLELFPQAFFLPEEYMLFELAFRQAEDMGLKSKWLVKFQHKSGIRIVHDIGQLKALSPEHWRGRTVWAGRETSTAGLHSLRVPKKCIDNYGRVHAVVTRYIDRPLLISGRKFDLELFVLVTSFTPLLRAYIYRLGCCRFCSLAYKHDTRSLTKLDMHLVNKAWQKRAKGFSATHDMTWSLSRLHLYLCGCYGHEKMDLLFKSIHWRIVHCLKAVQCKLSKQGRTDFGCFECYRFRLVVDSDFAPWIVSVKDLPKLNSTCAANQHTYTYLINDILNIVAPGGRIPFAQSPSEARTECGFFDLLYDEEKAAMDSQEVCAVTKQLKTRIQLAALPK